MEKAIEIASIFLVNGKNEIPNILKLLGELEEKGQILDYSLEEIILVEKYVDIFTVESFLEEIGIKA